MEKSLVKCPPVHVTKSIPYFDGLVQERRNSIANALELRLSCTNPSMWTMTQWAKASADVVLI